MINSPASPSLEIVAIIDGACPSNGKSQALSAAAAVLYALSTDVVDEYGLPVQAKSRCLVAPVSGKQTNQRAEIVAATLPFKALTKPAAGKSPIHVTVYSDSEYVINTMCGINKRKANLDLWAELDAALIGFEVTWVHMRGHQEQATLPLPKGDPTEAAKIALAQRQEGVNDLAQQLADQLRTMPVEQHATHCAQINESERLKAEAAYTKYKAGK